MREYVKAVIIVIGGLIVIGLLLLLSPLVVAFASVLWPLLLIPVAIVIVAELLKRRNGNY